MSQRRTRMGIIGGDGRGMSGSAPLVVGGPTRKPQRGIGPQTTRSPLTDTFPTFRQLRSSAMVIPRPAAGITFTGSHAVFPLINIPVSAISDQDVLLVAVHTVLGSPDTTQSQNGAAWGSTNGTGAAIVVGNFGKGLKACDGTGASWTPMILPVGYIDPAITALSVQSTQLTFASPFAPGTYASSPSRVDAAEDFPPHVARFRRMDRIQAAFVVTAAAATAARTASLDFRCLIELRLRLGLTFTLGGLANT